MLIRSAGKTPANEPVKRVIVVGAGPIGLYTAIKLAEGGLTNLLVCEPRDNYTRPGHVNIEAVRKIEDNLNIPLWSENNDPHLKDLERSLYKRLIELNITIEKNKFIRLHQDAKNPGIIVEKNGQEEVLHADFVFDCTGSKREVVSAVDQLIPSSPFKLIRFADMPVKNHFLAYVKIKPNDWYNFNLNREKMSHHISTMTPLQFTEHLIKLRTLGWTEFHLPRCYGKSFGKDKRCLYLYAPNNLAKENYDAWVQTVLECYYSPIQFEHLPPSQKPRFLTFTSDAQVLREFSYQGNNLPTVIALGDAQIDSNYFLAQGILDSIDRANVLFKHLRIVNNSIKFFDAAGYQLAIKDFLAAHQSDIIAEAKRVNSSFLDILESTQTKLNEALLLSTNEEQKAIVNSFLAEIQAKIYYKKASKISSDINVIVQSGIYNIYQLARKASEIHSDLLKAHATLPAHAATEIVHTKHLLNDLIFLWKNIARSFNNENKFLDAIIAYKNAIEIYKLNILSESHSQEVSTYFDLIVTHRKQKNYSDAYTLAKTTIAMIDNLKLSELSIPRALLVNELIKILFFQTVLAIKTHQRHEACTYYLEVNSEIAAHYAKKSLPHELGEMRKKVEAIFKNHPGLNNMLQNNREKTAASDAQILKSIGLNAYSNIEHAETSSTIARIPTPKQGASQ